MTIEEFYQKFDAAQEARPPFSFKDVPNKFSRRPDVHAFMLLDKILPPEDNSIGYAEDIVSASEHDQFWLSVDVEKLAAVITDEQIVELANSGVCYDSSNESLFMFA